MVCEYVREGIIATGAADDAIRLFVENKDGLVWIILPYIFSLGLIASIML